jgi:glutamyl/glutaminyl-tRNA synthetase
MSGTSDGSDPLASRWITRIAPTPSGFLHEGNLVNIVLTAWWARAEGGRLLLRVDDFDTPRLRREYLADIFATLDWLRIEPDDGPVGPEGFAEHWSMALRRAAFAAARDRLLAQHPDRVFVCSCSRRRLDPQGFCVAGCRRRGLRWVPGDRVVRLHVPPGTHVTAAASAGPPPPWAVPAGDHVLWRRDDLPAYQLGSVVADEDLAVTAVLRGVDLLESSALQLAVAALLEAPRFLGADLHHHGLLADAGGRKLSKSAGARAQPLGRTEALRAHVHRRAREIGAPIGIAPPP